MTYFALRYSRTRAAALVVVLLAGAGSAACGVLDVSDPTTILESEVSDAQSAELFRRGVLRDLYETTSGAVWLSGLMADEFFYQSPTVWDLAPVWSPEESLDRRESQYYVEHHGSIGIYGLWQALRMRTTAAAIEKLRVHALPGARGAHVGEMLAVRGYAALRLAEDFCPGFPLHDVVNYKMTYGSPLTTQEVFEYALKAFDSALTWTADSARVLNFARVGRARTLLNLGRFAEAASAVAGVPTSYVYRAEYSTAGPANEISAAVNTWWWGVERSVSNREGGNGFDFVSANDPRVRTDSVGIARNGVTRLYGVSNYPTPASPIVLANGIEARLIEAEAALQANQPGQWLAILNELRRTQASPALADTTDPGTTMARVNLHFRERAFWLFATGHRLGDLRRLLRQYGRSAESVFPTGPYWLHGGVYGTGTALPFNREEITYSPGVTGCTSW